MRIAALLLVIAGCDSVTAAEQNLPCTSRDDPISLSTLCGCANAQDVQFIRSRSVAIVSEMGWRTPESGGAISVVDVDTQAVRLGGRRTLWPASSASVSKDRLGDPQCDRPPSGAF